jgi:hypothetical protein
VRWATHIIWGAAALSLFGVNLYDAAAYSSLHTAVTDVLGHSGLRRSKYHDLISLLTAVVISAYIHSPAYIALGAVHIILDILSPGRLAVSVPYNILWSIPPALIILYTI